MKTRLLLVAFFLASIAAAQQPQRPMPREGGLKVGDSAPDFELGLRGGTEKVRLSSFRGRKPVALVFGSYTWPPFRHQVGDINRLHDRYKDKVEFLLVYIREAHPTDGRQLPVNQREGVLYAEPKTQEERHEVASVCVRKLDIRMPALIDNLKNTTEADYSGWPDRLYLIDREGRIAYKGQQGPAGFHPAELEAAIGRLLSP